MSTALTYGRIELARTFRNRKAFGFSLVFPLVLFVIIAQSNGGDAALEGTDLPASTYFMVSFATWGMMLAIISIAGRIAAERSAGWQRQLRITPLSPGAYLGTKVAMGYVLAISSMLLLYVAGFAMGVRIDAGRWVEMSALVLVGLVPFALLGVLIGHAAPSDSVGPIMGGGVSLLALLSGTWFPLPDHGVLHDIGQQLPSYWLVQAGRTAIGGAAWPAQAWWTLLAWTVVIGVLTLRVTRREEARS